MTRRLRPCRTCTPEDATGKFSLPRGFTRHKNRVCSKCRRRVPSDRDQVSYRGRGG